MTPFDTTILTVAGINPDSSLTEATSARANILTLSQAAEDAVLRPYDFGAFAHDLRAALAARVARLSDDEALAEHYLAGAGEQTVLADTEQSGAAQNLAEVVAFVDKTANQTRDIDANDILGLQAAGIGDADIVRLCELVAFLAYQSRVIAGLRLMQGAAA